MLWTHPHPAPPRYPQPPQGNPCPQLLQPAVGGCFPPEEGAGEPGALHGISTASRHGLALLGSAPGRHCSSRDRHHDSQGTARDFPGRTKTSGGGGEGEDGVGRGRERKYLHGCRMSRTALHGRRGGFSLRFSGGGAAGSRRHVGAARRRCLRSRRLVPGRPCLQALEEEGIARSPPGAVAELPDASPFPYGALLSGVALRTAAGGEWDRHQRLPTPAPSRLA